MRQAGEINKAKEAELQQLLTPDQLTKYQAAKEGMREKFEQRIEEKAGEGTYSRAARTLLRAAAGPLADRRQEGSGDSSLESRRQVG